MASTALDLAEYIKTLRLDPHSVNDGKWFANTLVVHGSRVNKETPKRYEKGTALPQLTNMEVADLLEQNAIKASGNSQAQADGNAPSQNELDQAQQDQQNKNDAGGQPQGGTDRVGVDENGQPLDPNANNGQPQVAGN